MVDRHPHALELRNIFKDFGSTEVLKDINVTVDKGAFLVLVGPSGCGKSTLLNCIAGLEETSSGAVLINGTGVTQLPPRERDIAMVFQSYALYPTMSVAENIAFGMKIRKVPRLEIEAKVNEVAQLLQIQELLDRRPGQLSGGQRQRVAMGRALVRNPELFLFDEPLSNLDAKLRVEMRAEIKRLHAATASTIVYVTHDQIEAMTLASTIVVLKDGKVQQVGTPAEIYHQPANTFVADFMGAPPMNLIPVRTDGSDRLIFEDGQTLNNLHLPGPVKGDVLLGIRPEIFAPGDMLTVKPLSIENTGSDVFLGFSLGGQTITARLPWNYDAGERVGLDVKPDQLVFFDRATGTRL